MNAVASAQVGSALAANRPLRVLQLRDSPWVDGPARTMIESGALFDRSRIEFHVGAFITDPASKHPLVEAAKARGLNVHQLRDHGGFDKALIASIRRLVTELQIDILHTSDARSNLYGLLSRSGLSVRLTTTTHGWIANNFRRWLVCTLDKVLLRRFDAVVMVSHAMRRLVPRWWLPASRTHVIHNALVLESYGSDVVSRPRRVVKPGDQVTILNIGRLSPEKGQSLVLEAVARIMKSHPNLRLRFIGIGPLEAELKAQTVALGIADSVEFAGYLADMPSQYLSADLIVQSSFTEGLPNVVLEAAYLRVPLVATAVGGTDEVVEHGKSAWLLRPRSVAALQQGIEAYLADPARFAQMARTAHERILQDFSMLARTEKMMRLYESLRSSE